MSTLESAFAYVAFPVGIYLIVSFLLKGGSVVPSAF